MNDIKSIDQEPFTASRNVRIVIEREGKAFIFFLTPDCPPDCLVLLTASWALSCHKRMKLLNDPTIIWRHKHSHTGRVKYFLKSEIFSEQGSG